MGYIIKKIDTHEIELRILSEDTIEICIDGFRDGYFNYIQNIFIPCQYSHYKNLTARQQKNILIAANRYFLNVYKEDFYIRLQAGEFFAPTIQVYRKEMKLRGRLVMLHNNIEKLKGVA